MPPGRSASGTTTSTRCAAGAATGMGKPPSRTRASGPIQVVTVQDHGVPDPGVGEWRLDACGRVLAVDAQAGDPGVAERGDEHSRPGGGGSPTGRVTRRDRALSIRAARTS